MNAFHVYLDESYVDGSSRGFRIQGGVWIPNLAMRDVREAFKELRGRHPKIAEFKWSYVTGRQPLTVYEDLVDLFFRSAVAPCLSFKCLVIRGADDGSRQGGKVEKDLGFYKAFYTLLNWRLADGSVNHVRLDKRTGPRATPESSLREALNSASQNRKSPFHVATCKCICSKEDDLMQLADVLLGAVGWAWNGMRSTCGAKPALHARIVSHLGWETLKERATGPSEPKFNVWRYRPKE